MRYLSRAAVFTLLLALLGSCYVFDNPYDPDSPSYTGDPDTQDGGDTGTPPADAPTFPPAAPTGLRAHGQSASEILVEWTDASDNETGFLLEGWEGSESGGIDDSTVFAEQIGADLTAHVVAGLKPATIYTFRIQAFNDAGSSDWSSPVEGTTSNGSVGTTN